MQKILKFLFCKSGTQAQGTEEVCLDKVTHLIRCRVGHAAQTCVKLGWHRQVAHVPEWVRRLSRKSRDDQAFNDIWNTYLQNKKPQKRVKHRTGKGRRYFAHTPVMNQNSRPKCLTCVVYTCALKLAAERNAITLILERGKMRLGKSDICLRFQGN